MIDDAHLSELRARIWRFIRRRVRDADLADDLTQELMLRLHRRREELPETPERRVAWALRVARNLVIDQHRTARPRLERLSPEHDRAQPAEVEQARRLAGCLPGMVRRLPPEYARAVELADLDGWTQQAVAGELELSLSGAKSRIQRGRAQLGELIEQCCRVERSAVGGIVSVEPTLRSQEFCRSDEESCVH